MKNRVEILFCNQCCWRLRAAWMTRELLSTFDQEISGLTLKPGTGGMFEIRANGVLKQRVRDHITPGGGLGHADRQGRDMA